VWGMGNAVRDGIAAKDRKRRVEEFKELQELQEFRIYKTRFSELCVRFWACPPVNLRDRQAALVILSRLLPR
jgi:hypothetical protein